MNYVRTSGGQCEHVADPTGKITDWERHDRERDCEEEGFYYKNQGYRKIPLDQCYGGIVYDQTKHQCGAFSSLGEKLDSFNIKKIILGALIGACLYYGWPIIEAIILILPINNPSGVFSKLVGFL